jgi:hypothetical protein
MGVPNPTIQDYFTILRKGWVHNRSQKLNLFSLVRIAFSLPSLISIKKDFEFSCSNWISYAYLGCRQKMDLSLHDHVGLDLWLTESVIRKWLLRGHSVAFSCAFKIYSVHCILKIF